MTDIQAQRARALAKCRLPAFGSAKRFVEQMEAYARDQVALLSPAQDKALSYYAWHFREQLRALGFGNVVPLGNPYGKATVEQFEMKLT